MIIAKEMLKFVENFVEVDAVYYCEVVVVDDCY